MKILGIDFETNGLNPATDRVIEVGAVLWDTDRQKPLMMLSELIAHVIPDGIKKITGITQEDVDVFGSADQPLRALFSMEGRCDAIMAHNSDFDMGFRFHEYKRLGLYVGFDKPIIDTMVDLPIDRDIHQSMKLSYLAASHGFLNPFPHRALFDVLTMLKIASQYNIDQVLRRAKSPTVTYQALVSFEDKDKAKQAGFYWDGDPKVRKWLRKMKECDYTEGMFTFRVVKV